MFPWIKKINSEARVLTEDKEIQISNNKEIINK